LDERRNALRIDGCELSRAPRFVEERTEERELFFPELRVRALDRAGFAVEELACVLAALPEIVEGRDARLGTPERRSANVSCARSSATARIAVSTRACALDESSSTISSFDSKTR
jgi:hypothetical protein